ncbi:MAG: DoxX family membrane protein [Acidobacteriota bacterium]
MQSLVDRLRAQRWSRLGAANLRILLGFAFLPSGLKKVLGQPFTDPSNSGPFHDFLDAFHATGFFYPWVGSVQLLAAVLLMTQTHATLGAAIMLPVMTVITVFCWSTGVVPTAIVATLMLGGVVALIVWDLDRWMTIVRSDHVPSSVDSASTLIDRSLWRRCGTGILILYVTACVAYGGVYRPKGADFDHPAFYALIVIALFPVFTLIVETRRRRAGGAET